MKTAGIKVAHYKKKYCTWAAGIGTSWQLSLEYRHLSQNVPLLLFVLFSYEGISKTDSSKRAI